MNRLSSQASFFRRRRILLSSPLALLASSFPLTAHAQQTPRLALVVGNRNYPQPEDLPPAHKNARDVSAALRALGFEVETRTDLVSREFKSEVANFAARVAAAGPDCISMLFYTGHGAQLQADNLLIPVSLSPYSSDVATQSVHLFNDIVNRLPGGQNGLNMVVIDACRTSLTAANSARDGLNQVEAPGGSMIVFSTGAGRPAISPAVETMNSFFVSSFVKVLTSLSAEASFSDMFRLVKMDVQESMLAHPVAAIRKVAQNPFIAENSKGRHRVRLGAPASAAAPLAGEKELWDKLESETWPPEVAKLARQFIGAYPAGDFLQPAKVARAGAEDGERALRSRDVKLFRSAFQVDAGNEAFRRDLLKAGRGDKDAAMRIGSLYRTGNNGIARDESRYIGWLQYAVELGNGIASYELAKHFRASGQEFFSSRFEARAIELGFTPPASLDNVRK